MKISVVIPIYGCSSVIPELHERITNTLLKLTNDYEIILVNDNCPQNSWKVIEDICAKDNKVIGIELSRNFGQMKAILAGLDKSTGDYVVVMDCDLQDRPEEIENLYNKLMEGYDTVFVKRLQRKDSTIKILLSKLFYKMYSLATEEKYDPDLCNFSISKRIVIDSYCKMREQHRAFVMYMKWVGFKRAIIEVEHNERKEGKSSYDFKRRMKLATDIIFSQSDKLLKLIVSFGFLLTFLSLIVVAALIINYFVNPQVQTGWSSIIAITCLIGGMIISVVGAVGLYVGNIFMQTKDRPLYIIRSMINDNIKEEG